MRYILALICPPIALLSCKKSFQAVVAALLLALAYDTANSGLGYVIAFFVVLWAFHAVGDHAAAREARAFVRTVDPIPVIRF